MQLAWKLVLAAGVAIVPACQTDPCQTFQTAVQTCPEFVDINGTSSASTGTGTPVSTCDDKQESVAQCLLNSGVDPCKIDFHPDMLSDAEKRKVAACKAGL